MVYDRRIVVAAAVSSGTGFKNISAAGDGGSYNIFLLISRRINNIQRHRQKEIRNQNRQRRDHDRLGGDRRRGRGRHLPGGVELQQLPVARDKDRPRQRNVCDRALTRNAQPPRYDPALFSRNQ